MRVRIEREHEERDQGRGRKLHAGELDVVRWICPLADAGDLQCENYCAAERQRVAEIQPTGFGSGHDA